MNKLNEIYEILAKTRDVNQTEYINTWLYVIMFAYIIIVVLVSIIYSLIKKFKNKRENKLSKAEKAHSKYNFRNNWVLCESIYLICLICPLLSLLLYWILVKIATLTGVPNLFTVIFGIASYSLLGYVGVVSFLKNIYLFEVISCSNRLTVFSGKNKKLLSISWEDVEWIGVTRNYIFCGCKFLKLKFSGSIYNSICIPTLMRNYDDLVIILKNNIKQNNIKH